MIKMLFLALFTLVGILIVSLQPPNVSIPTAFFLYGVFCFMLGEVFSTSLAMVRSNLVVGEMQYIGVGLISLMSSLIYLMVAVSFWLLIEAHLDFSIPVPFL